MVSFPGSLLASLLLSWLLFLLLVASFQGKMIKGDVNGPSSALAGASHFKLKVILVALVVELKVNLIKNFMVLCLANGITLCN